MNADLIRRAEQRDFQKLFLSNLNWAAPDTDPIAADHEGQLVTATNVASHKGLRVWVVNETPDAKLEAAVDRRLAKASTDRIVIFHDAKEQVWRWPVRRAQGNGTVTRLSRHRHRNGEPNPRFAERLDAIRLPSDEVLDSNAVLAKVRAAFDVESHNETKHASALMLRMYMAMDKAYTDTDEHPEHDISVTLARVLFMMFGDDTEMWEVSGDLFRDYILERTHPDGSDIAAALSELFTYLDTPPADRTGTPRGHDGFPYVNGGIFHEHLELPTLNADFRTAVLEACDRDWANISPAIFGSMFQSVRDPDKRRELGEHYTSEENILRTLQPLFLDDLRAEFAHIRTLGKHEKGRLEKFREKLGQIRFMDPACGCGNFIIVAYRELRDLELLVLERRQEITGDERMLLANIGLKVTLDHFYGMELDEWPARIAETAMFLVDRQSDLKLHASLGWAPTRLPIQEQATIRVCNALRTDWATVCPHEGEVIVAGNPPFRGHEGRKPEQTADLKYAWGSETLSRLDLVTGWHAKAMGYFAGRPGDFAFVATNSITQGDPVPHLFKPLFDAGWKIKFAHRTFRWTSEATGAAVVYCVIVGFTKDLGKSKPRLFDYPKGAPATERTVDNINGYLAEGPNVFVTKRSRPLVTGLPRCVFGNMPRDEGALVVKADAYADVHADPIARKYLRPYFGTNEIVSGADRWCLWMEDLDPDDLERSAILRERIHASRDVRLKSDAVSTRKAAETAHLFVQRKAVYTEPYLLIARASKEARVRHPALHVQPQTIGSDTVFTASDPDGVLFALVSSSMFMTWQKAVGGRWKEDPRFSSTIVWNNLPIPQMSDKTRQTLAAAGQRVASARATHQQLTLDEMCSPEEGLPQDLRDAYADLDKLVDRAFGLNSPKATTAERQRRLFKLYDELATALSSQ